MRASGGHDDLVKAAENRTVTQYLVVVASVQGRSKRIFNFVFTENYEKIINDRLIDES